MAAFCTLSPSRSTLATSNNGEGVVGVAVNSSLSLGQRFVDSRRSGNLFSQIPKIQPYHDKSEDPLHFGAKEYLGR